MSVRLPSRYEDLDVAFRGHLKPNPLLIQTVQLAFQSMKINGGIRFLPIYGRSGSGKSSAALELATHLPEMRVITLSHEAVELREHLLSVVRQAAVQSPGQPLICVIDQFEEVAAQKSAIPKSFVESLALLDRGELRNFNVLFIWLTTNRGFQSDLVNATTRNRRILVSPSFEVEGPSMSEWPSLIEETFSFHNSGTALADYDLIESDLVEIVKSCATIGEAIEKVGGRLVGAVPQLQNISTYQVVMLWPVTDGVRISRIQQFTDARQGYQLDWNAWYRSLNSDEQRGVELRDLNRARLYFDVRLVPIAAADLLTVCKDRGAKGEIPKTALERFSKTHYFSVVVDKWNASSYAPLRERESARADEAREWYAENNAKPTVLGGAIAKALTALGIPAKHEVRIKTPHGSVRADVLAERSGARSQVITELKAFSPENTMPSTISSAIHSTLRRHAVLAGFIKK